MDTTFKPCRKCKDKGPSPGLIFTKVDGHAAVKPCDCFTQYQKDIRRKSLQERGSIWERAFEYYPEHDYVGDQSVADLQRLVKYATDFEKFSENIVYIWGPNGTQKTTLAQWVGATLINKNKTVKYLLMQNLLSELSSGFESEEGKKDRIEYLLDVDLLIVDESFSKDKVTLYASGYQLPFLDRFLRERVEMRRKGILFISNKASTEIEANKFSYSIQDFVIRNSLRSTLYFQDNYVKNAADFNPGSLFD